MPSVHTTYDHPFTGPPALAAPASDPPAWSARLPARARVAAAAAVLVLGAAAVTVCAEIHRRLRRLPATATALPYEPHELIVGYRGAASNLLKESERRARIAVAVSPRPELTPGELLARAARGA